MTEMASFFSSVFRVRILVVCTLSISKILTTFSSFSVLHLRLLVQLLCPIRLYHDNFFFQLLFRRGASCKQSPKVSIVGHYTNKLSFSQINIRKTYVSSTLFIVALSSKKPFECLPT